MIIKNITIIDNPITCKGVEHCVATMKISTMQFLPSNKFCWEASYFNFYDVLPVIKLILYIEEVDSRRLEVDER